MLSAMQARSHASIPTSGSGSTPAFAPCVQYAYSSLAMSSMFWIVLPNQTGAGYTDQRRRRATCCGRSRDGLTCVGVLQAGEWRPFRQYYAARPELREHHQKGHGHEN
jgi:hypothetical protein